MQGKAKEVVGETSGNKELKAEGSADRKAGEVKEALGKVERKVDVAVHKVKDVLHKR